MSKQSQKEVTFHFVPGNPQSESEKKDVRTIVRSNASNRRWRLARETSTKSKGTESMRDTVVPHVATTETFADWRVSNPARDIEVKPVKKQRLGEKHVHLQSRASRDAQSMVLANPAEPTSLTRTFFGSMPDSEVSKQSITRMLQGTALTYAQLFPSGKRSPVSEMAKHWFQQCLATSGTMHTALFCQAVRLQAVRPGSSSLSLDEFILCQTEAVHAINTRLLQSATACDDESLRMVFSLCWHGAIKQDSPSQSPKQSPLTDLQSLKLFMGTITCNPIHAQGLDEMLELRGGLEDINMPGLAFLISYGDILRASCNLTRPTWAYGSYAQYYPEAAVDDEWHRVTHRSNHVLASLAQGFSALYHWLPHERAGQLHLVLCEMADYTRASHDYILTKPDERNCAVMADQRNSVQHKLMSLCLTESDQFCERGLFELYWLAGVAYSSIAVFPIAPNAARFGRFADLIHQRLTSTSVAQQWARTPDLVLWASVIAALCAIGTDFRPWYVRSVREQIGTLDITTWECLKLRLMQFLWFPQASDTDGQQLWIEITRIDPVANLQNNG